MEALKKKTFLGVIPDIPDPRDAFVTAAPQAYTLPIVMPISSIKDQGKTLRCNTKCDLHGPEVAFKQEFSDNFIYAEACSPAGGSSPRKSAEHLIKIGMVPAKVDPVNTLEPPAINAYVDQRRDKLVAAAEPFKFERYAFLHTPDEIKAVMLQADKYPGLYIKYTMPYDGSEPDQYGFWDIKNIKNPTGFHEVLIAVAEMHLCKLGNIETVKTANSWSEEWGNGKAGTLTGTKWNGRGFFWTDWDGVLSLDNVIAVWPKAGAAPVIEGVVFHKSIRLKDPLMTDADTNGEVSWVQKRLVVHGYKVDVDGKFGEITEKVVKAFQLSKGKTVDGVVGPITWADLEKDPATVDPPPDPDPDIKAALRANFRQFVFEQVGNLYCWRGKGETAITEAIIKAMETSVANASRAIAFWKKLKAAGVQNIRMFDCSGLPSRWLMDHAIITKRTDCDGLWKLCESVAIDELQPLDLIFRGDPHDFYHVGIYLGDGLVIEAQGRDAGVVLRGIYAGGKTYWTYAGRLNCLK